MMLRFNQLMADSTQYAARYQQAVSCQPYTVNATDQREIV